MRCQYSLLGTSASTCLRRSRKTKLSHAPRRLGSNSALLDSKSNPSLSRPTRCRPASTFPKRRNNPSEGDIKYQIPLHQRERFCARYFTSTPVASQHDPGAEQLGPLDEYETCQITYLTDVEGDGAYLDRYVDISRVLEFENTPKTPFRDISSSLYFPYEKRICFSKPNAILVFGGDVWDKGGRDLYVIRQLLDFKRRHPDRVYIVLGNRDINKLRILQELGLESDSAPPSHPGLKWFQGSGMVGDPNGPPIPDDFVGRLKWILKSTMGSPDAFEHRKAELEWECGREVEEIDVVHSYQRSCHPDGELGAYLSSGSLILKLGPILVVHGALPLTSDITQERRSEGCWNDWSIYMPWLEKDAHTNEFCVASVSDWMRALNQFCADRIYDWKTHIEDKQAITALDKAAEQEEGSEQIWAHEGGYHYGPSYGSLIQYGMGLLPNQEPNPTVVYNSFTPSGMPKEFAEGEPNSMSTFAIATKDFMDKAGVSVILSGHKPQGDMPTSIRVDRSRWVVCADTSYSGNTRWYQPQPTKTASLNCPSRKNLGRGNSKSFRGDVAVSEVLLECRKAELCRVSFHGVLSDGSSYESVNLLEFEEISTIGRQAPTRCHRKDSPGQGIWWTKTVLCDGTQFYYTADGFEIWNHLVEDI